MDRSQQENPEDAPLEEGDILEQENDDPVQHTAGTAEPGFFQQQMHLENSRRLGKIETQHTEMIKTLATIAANTADLPKLKEDVDKLKSDRNKVAGALGLVVGGTPFLSWLATKYFKF